jgi:hypothetical protein
LTHAPICLDPGYILGPFNRPNVSNKIEFLTFLCQRPSSNWILDFCFSTGCPQFSSRLAATSLELIGPTDTVFHEESGHAIEIGHRPL